MGFPTTTEITFCSLKIPNLLLRMTVQWKTFSKLLNAVSSGDINTKAFMTTVRNYAKTWSQTGRDCLSRESFVRIESKVHLFWSEMNAKMLDRPQTSFSFHLRFCAAYRSEESYYRKCGKRLWMTMTYGEYSKHFSQYLRQTLLGAQNCTHSWSKKKTAQNSLGHPFTQKISLAYIFRNYYQWKTEMTQSPGCWRTSWVHE